MTSDKNTTQAPFWTTRASFVFATCALLGILLLIFSEVGMAQPGGFRPGSGPAIGNPLSDEMEDDEDFGEDFDEIPEMRPPPRAGVNNGASPAPGFNPGSSGGGISVGGSYDDKPVAQVARGKNGLQLSGPGSERAMKSKNTSSTLPVDTESGEGIPASKEMITDFNFPDANVMDIAKTLGKLTGKNFILDKEVSKGQQSVTIISNSPITVSDAWRAFLTSLDMNGLALVPSGKYLRIMRQTDAKGKNVRMYSNKNAPNTDALVTKIFKLKYISSKDFENVVRTYASMGARIYGHEQTNTLIITDTGSNIEKVARMIAFLDVEGFDAGIEVVQVKFASAVELSKLIGDLLPGNQAGVARPGGFPGGASSSRGNFTARKTKEGGLINNIIPDERTNTLIVHANPKGVDQVRELVARLDRKIPAAALGGGKVHVVRLEFADAEDMSKTLSNFSQNTRSPSPGGFNPGGGIGVNPNEGNLFEGQVKISADKPTNSLVVTASPADFETLQRVINKLDIPRDQVFVEVIIMEMNMERGSEFAANILMPGGGVSVSPTNDLAQLLQNPASGGKGLILSWKNQQTIKMNTPDGKSIELPSIAALLKAIQTYSNANILATPQLMALDNSEATFESSDVIPYAKTTSLGLGTAQQSIETKEIPLTIKIKPQLKKWSNFIKLDIKANLSDVSSKAPPKAVEDQFPATIKRVVETSVVVADSDTVVLGGLTRDKSEETQNKVPLLGDIPVLGWLFKSKSTRISKTNMMLFITPKIVRQYESIRQVLDQKLKERDEFVDKAMGGVDYHREYRNKMIRRLPDVSTIQGYNSKRSLNLDEEEVLKDKNNQSMAPKEGRDSLTLPPAEQIPQPAPQSLPPVTAPPSTGPSTEPDFAPPAPGGSG